MAGDPRKTFLVRLDPKSVEALRRWADDEFRSLNGQIEFILHEALRKQGRLPKPKNTNSKSD
jgi:hypothetical protein